MAATAAVARRDGINGNLPAEMRFPRSWRVLLGVRRKLGPQQPAEPVARTTDKGS
jgi:hypothetical protein